MRAKFIFLLATGILLSKLSIAQEYIKPKHHIPRGDNLIYVGRNTINIYNQTSYTVNFIVQYPEHRYRMSCESGQVITLPFNKDCVVAIDDGQFELQANYNYDFYLKDDNTISVVESTKLAYTSQ